MNCFETDIKTLFSKEDRDGMINLFVFSGGAAVDLHKYADVSAHANEILACVANQSMPPPPAAPWTQDMINTFQAWIDAGTPEFAPPQISVINPGNIIDFNDVPVGETAM